MKKITEVQNYFIEKLLRADFQVIKITYYVCEVLIDGEFSFNIWIANNLIACEPYTKSNTFMQLPKFDQIQVDQMGQMMAQIISDSQDQIKAARIQELQNELSTLITK